VLVRLGQEVQALPRRLTDPVSTIVSVSDVAAPLDAQLEELGAQLDWVREYL
jgi:hypothetical protein